ncbi:hypothetical protein KR093_009475, partial [Drosophila rubida]
RLLASVCGRQGNGSSTSVEIQLPFMDMQLQHEGRLHVLQAEQLLLLLHGHELFQWHVAGQEKRLVRLGQLEGRVQQQAAVAAAVVLWHEDLLFAVALPDSLEFYQLPQEELRNSSQWQLRPIQEFGVPGKLHRLQLLKTQLDQVVLLLAVNSTQTQSKCLTFEWLQTYFNPVAELLLPPLEAFQVVGHQPHYIVTGRSLRGQSALVLTVYELETPSLRLRRRQSLTVHARHVRATRFRGRNHLIACARNATASCLLFRMLDGSFVVYRKHSLRQLHFAHLAASPRGQLLAAARGNGEVLVFNSHRFDCYSGFGADPAPSGLHVHRNPRNETFLLLSYQPQANVTLLRLVQLGGANESASSLGSLDGNDELSSVQVHRHEFEETINALRSLLLRRRKQLDALQRLATAVQQARRELRLGSGARVEQVNVQGQHLQTPTQLQRRMEQLRQHYAANRRTARSFGVGNASSATGQEVLQVRRLHVRHLIYDGELVPDYYVDNSSTPILSIKGKLLAKRLRTQQLLTPQSYQRPRRALDPLLDAAGGSLAVRQLHVARINNVSWFDFYDSLFLQSRDNHIEGRLIVQSRARVVNLETPLLNGLVVEQLFNLRQPQRVSSNLFMSAFFVSQLEAQLINGLDFAHDVVFRGDNATLIKTPVHIYQMHVSGDLLVANATKRRSQATTTAGGMQQYYTGRVTLNGTLTVNSVLRDTDASQLLLGQQSLRQQDLHADYLLLRGEQNLSALRFGNAKVTTPALHSDHINGHPVAEHLLDAPLAQPPPSPHAKPLHLILMEAQVGGDVHCSNMSSRLAQLAQDAVRRGETATISGHKQFEAPLSVASLSSERLNGIASDDLLLKTQQRQRFTQLKRFERIVVKQQAVVADELRVEELNSLPLTQLLQRGYSLQRLELAETPQLQQLRFQRLNNLPFDELLDQLSVNSDDEDDEDEEQPQQLLLRKQLIVEGNVRFEQPLQLDTLNGVAWSDYVPRLVSGNANALLSGRKVFAQPVRLTDALQAPSIGGLDLAALLDNTLLRTTPQSIPGSYQFRRLTVGNLDVPAINGQPASSFLDTRRSQQQLAGALHVRQLRINGSLSCRLPHDPLPALHDRLAALQQRRQWRQLTVLGDALHPAAPSDSQLSYLRQHAVRRRGAPQTISGHQPRLRYLEYEQPALAAVWNASGDFEAAAAILPQLTRGCQLRELRAQLDAAQQRVLLSTASVGERAFKASAWQGALRVKAHNNCRLGAKLRSRIRIQCRGRAHTLAMRQPVEQLALLELLAQSGDGYSLLLLSTEEEVRVLRIDAANCSLSDWQSLPSSAGRRMQLLELTDAPAPLLLTAAPERQRAALEVHRLAAQSERFEWLQRIEGDYDLVELVEQQLLLSCRRCRRIEVHGYSAELQRFRPLQQLRLEARVQQLLPFAVGQQRHLLVLSMAGSANFYLLSRTPLAAWQPRTYGLMADVLWSWPLVRSGEQLARSTPVLLLCGERQCSVVHALIA